MRYIKSNGSFLFEGVVENRDDPLKIGRVQVRIFGFHTEDKSEIPTEDLHWASVLMPVTSASVSGIGHTPSLLEGSHVVGYFRDGIRSQDPVIIGSILGIPIDEVDTSTGFNDPNGKYPKYTDEPDTSRLARNEKSSEDTILSTKTSTKISGISTPTGSYDEPASPYGAKYPFNKVIETESGHVIELDDTEGAERVHIAHKSGTFIEMHPDGTIVIKSTKDTFDLTSGSKNEYTKGSHNLTIDATGNIYCKGNYTFKTDGDMKFDVAGNVEWNVTGDLTASAQNMNIEGKTATIVKGSSTTMTLNTSYNVQTSGQYTVTASKISFA